MAEFKTFMSMVTGRTGRYPARFASRPTFIEVDPREAPCFDCLPDDMFRFGSGDQEQAVPEDDGAVENDTHFLELVDEDEYTETEEI